MNRRKFLNRIFYFIVSLISVFLGWNIFSFNFKKRQRKYKIKINNLIDGVNEIKESNLIIIKEKNKFKVLDSTCTHLGCKVKWIKDKNFFECPCHRSIFDINGKVIRGPAKKSLKKLDFKNQENYLLICSKDF